MYSFVNIGKYGRLGNQLFQYATLKTLSLKNSVPLILPPPDIHRIADFNTEVGYDTVPNIMHHMKHRYEEATFCYDPGIWNCEPNTDFVGYFQTEKYFIDIRDTLLEELVPRDSSSTKTAKMLVDSLPGDVVGMHVRRGDYTGNDGYVQLEKTLYYQRAMCVFPNASFVIVSDDIEWCKKNFVGSNISYSEGYDDLVDFEILRLSDHIIMANSSFSWWGAWLNQNKDKVIITPRQWFGPKLDYNDTRDLIPDTWNRV